MKRSIASFTIEGVFWRLIRDDETEPGSAHYWAEKQEQDRTGVGRWVETHSAAIKTTDAETAKIPSGIPARVLAAFFERLSGNR